MCGGALLQSVLDSLGKGKTEELFMSRIYLALGLTATLVGWSTCYGQSAEKASSSVPNEGVSPRERQVLLDLYKAADGGHWKNHDGWMGPAGTECTWYGVTCESPAQGPNVVDALNLAENGLQGNITATLDQLNHLEWLYLFGNRLSGMLPLPLIQRWLSGSLQIAAEASLLTEVSEIDYEYHASALLCARRRIVFRADSRAEIFDERCRKSTPEDRTTFCEAKEGRILGPEFARLAWLLEERGFFSLHANYEINITDSVFVSTRVTRAGKTYEVVEYAGGGPFELWEIHHTIEGVATLIEWEKTKKLSKCPPWDKSSTPLPP
jgi:hypothetical protein